MVRGLTMTTDRVLRASGVLLALCLSLAALVVAWGQTTRTTATGSPAGTVFRENLRTGEAEFCRAANGAARCVPVQRPRFDGEPVKTAG